MNKINLKFLQPLIYVLSIFFITNLGKSSYDEENPKYIYGRVIYSDDRSPVSDGLIKVFSVNNVSNQGKILETTNIESNGVFKLLNQNIQTDGIKIMAYPNDYDSEGPPFEPEVLDVGKWVSNSDAEFVIIIEVKRIKDNINKSQGIRELREKTNSMLKQNFPNPFNPTTLIRFELPQTSNVTLKIYNTNGEAVSTLVDNKSLTKGINEFEFNASSLPSGIYIYNLTTGDYSETRKMMLLK